MAASPSNPSADLLKLDGYSFDALLAWLERALRGRETLPLIVPDETPESPILRERRLAPRTRDDLREACLRLVRRFACESCESCEDDDDEYVLALLRLATGLQIKDAVDCLHALAVDAERFSNLSERQRWGVLSTLLDLRAPVSLDFWKAIAARDPQRHGVLAVAALLGHGPRSAFEVLPSLPDDETVADALYVVLDQHAAILIPEQRSAMIAASGGVQGRCAPKIREALEEWAEGHALQGETPGEEGSRQRLLDVALAAFFSRDGNQYAPHPSTARLIPCATS